MEHLQPLAERQLVASDEEGPRFDPMKRLGLKRSPKLLRACETRENVTRRDIDEVRADRILFGECELDPDLALGRHGERVADNRSPRSLEDHSIAARTQISTVSGRGNALHQHGSQASVLVFV